MIIIIQSVLFKFELFIFTVVYLHNLILLRACILFVLHCVINYGK